MSQSAQIDLSSVRVLCVDDDPVMRSLVRSALQRRGCRDVVQANSGIDALDLCAGRAFDMLICDVQMEPMNGIDFLRALANSGLGRGLPVIMLSAETNPATIQDAQELGISAWVGKPVSIQVLLERITAVLRLNGQIRGGLEDQDIKATTDRHHAQLMSALASAEEASQSLAFRGREAPAVAHSLRAVFEAIGEHGKMLGFGLVTRLAARGLDLVGAMTRNPPAAIRAHADSARALGVLVTAMKRVGQNRMEGDGGEAGTKLLMKIDAIVGPVRAGMR